MCGAGARPLCVHSRVWLSPCAALPPYRALAPSDSGSGPSCPLCINLCNYTPLATRYFSHYTCAQNAKYRKMCGSGPLSSRCARARVGLRCVIHVLLRSDTRGPFFSLSKRRRLSDCTSDCDKSREASSELRDARGRCSEQRSFARRQLRPSVQCWVRYDG